ncbi:hypothetical protein X962_6206 [Burkholderia pseudomallei MSHR7343]|nr:hypothetical protein X962_6206 [Burkholderia pseudomallei MSHR7343]
MSAVGLGRPSNVVAYEPKPASTSGSATLIVFAQGRIDSGPLEWSVAMSV